MSAIATGSVTPGPVPDLVAPRRRVGMWIVAGVLVIALASAARSVATNPNIDHGTIAEYLFDGRVLSGLLTTLQLAIVAMVLGVTLGIGVSLLRLSDNPVLSTCGWLYVWVFRGTPLLVQVLFWGNFALFAPRVSIGVPFTDVTAGSWDTNDVITRFVASLLALGLHEAALMAEIVRSGIMSVSAGQTHAAMALGLTRPQLMRKIVLPQALRVIVPPTGNQLVTMLKMTSLVSVIAGGDMLTEVQNIAAVNLRTIELLTVATTWYLLVISMLSLGQALLERRLRRGFGATHSARDRRAGRPAILSDVVDE